VSLCVRPPPTVHGSPARAGCACLSTSQLPAESTGPLRVLQTGTTLEVSDVQDVVLHALLPDTRSPRWLAFDPTTVSRVLLLSLTGLDWSLFEQHRARLPCLGTRFMGEPRRVYGIKGNPTASVNQTLLSLLLCSEQQAQRALGRTGKADDPTKRRVTMAAPARVKDAPEPFPPAYYVATPGQLADNNYPLPVVDADSGELRCKPGFVVTQPAGQGIAKEPHHQMLALDCEMCYTAVGLELTRCSVVDAHGDTVYDQLVLPHAPIVDYNTQHSGITAEHMAGVTTHIEDVQADLLELIAEETILIGHSLENDLIALKMVHRKVVDTSLLYTHPRGPPYKPALRVLCDRLLGRKIQDGSHDSVQDAVTSMELAKLKFAKGPAFGGHHADGVPIADVLGNARPPVRVSMIGKSTLLGQLATGAASAIVANGDADAAKKAARELQKPAGPVDGAGSPGHLVWCHLPDLCTLQEARAQRARRRAEMQWSNSDSETRETVAQEVAEEVQKEALVLSQADACVASLLDAAPAGTLVLVHSGQGDAAAARRLLESKMRRKQGLDGGPWGDDDETALRDASERAQNGLLIIALPL
jgi:RNA exonuclease 1